MIPIFFFHSVVYAASEDYHETVFNSGIELGSLYNSELGFTGNLALRISIVQHIDAKWEKTKEKPALYPWKWRGGYLRIDQPSIKYRFVLGYGASIPTKSMYSTVLGYEFGFIAQSDFTSDPIVYGAELGAVCTFGIIGVYVREIISFRESPYWETQIGLRLLLPVSLMMK